MKKIRVFLGDDNVVFREGMHFILESEEDMEVVGEGRTIKDVTAFLQEHPVDVVVLSQEMEDKAGLIPEAFPSVGIVLVGDSNFQQATAVADSILLTRDMEPEELAPAVREARYSYNETQGSGSSKGEEESSKSPVERLISLVDAL